MGNWLSIAPTWWELLRSILKQGYVYIIWKGDIIKCRVENKGSKEYPRLELEWHHTYPVRLIERDYKVTWSKNKEDLEVNIDPSIMYKCKLEGYKVVGELKKQGKF